MKSAWRLGSLLLVIALTGVNLTTHSKAAEKRFSSKQKTPISKEGPATSTAAEVFVATGEESNVSGKSVHESSQSTRSIHGLAKPATTSRQPAYHPTPVSQAASPTATTATPVADNKSSASATARQNANLNPSVPGKYQASPLVGMPQIQGLHPSRQPSLFGNGWFSFTDTYTGAPPTEPAAGALIIPSIQIQAIYLGSSFQTTNTAVVTTLEAYLGFLATSSFLTEFQGPYGASAGKTVTGQVIGLTLPNYASTSQYLLDADIVGDLQANINNGALTPPTPSTVYVVFVEPGVAVDAGGGLTSVNSFLGYHNTAQITKTGGAVATIYYAVIPYPGSPNPTPDSQGFSSVTDELTAVTSHEVAEAATDPDTVNGWQETVSQALTLKLFGWTVFKWTRALGGEEIADVPLLLNNYSPQCYARYGNGYLVQQAIGPDGTTMLTPSGATHLSASASQAVAAPFAGILPIVGRRQSR